LQVKVAIVDPSEEIKPEMLARARFLATPDPRAGGRSDSTLQTLVPQAAIFEHAGRSCVWLADQVARAARRTAVTPGRAEIDGWRVISDGLRPGDRVIVDAPEALTEGQRIRILEQ
jgi:multidrug efflux pump subunit AcrA (membrane-fusion protein)